MNGEDVLQALRARPGGRQLLALASQCGDVALVGGAVRDLLLGRQPRELDVVVAADAPSAARHLADALGASTAVHERFGTAVVEWEAGRIDIAARRAESYPRPGALPQVSAGSAEQDLQRRDFTVNAIAVPLAGPRRGELQHAQHALEDLQGRRLRVLHDRSFADDPTRLLRLARYHARLRFDVEPHTRELARAALEAGALRTVSAARIGAELRLALAEDDAAASLQAMDDLGVLAALDPRLRFDATLAHAALELLTAPAHEAGDARADTLLLAVLAMPVAGERDRAGQARARALLGSLEFPAGERDVALAAATGAPALAGALAATATPSQVYEAASSASPEAVALAGAWAAAQPRFASARNAARAWLADVRHVRLAIDGEDLLAAGVPEGPEIGLRLRAALLCKLDGRLRADGSDAELTAALEASV